MYFGSSGRHLRQSSLKAGTPRPNGLSKGHKRPPPSLSLASLLSPLLIHCLRDRRMPWNNTIRERLTGRRRRRAEPGERERGREGERHCCRRSWMREDDRCPLLPKCACLIPPVNYLHRLKGLCMVARKLFLVLADLSPATGPHLYTCELLSLPPPPQ